MSKDVRLPANDWTDLHAQSGIAVGKPLLVQNKMTVEITMISGATKPAADSRDGSIVRPGEFIQITAEEGQKAWARHFAQFRGRVFVQEDRS